MILSSFLKHCLFIEVLILLCIATSFSSNVCPRPECECLGNDISCEKQDFQKIPWQKFPTWAESISLRQLHNFGHLPTSTAKSLARLIELKHLNISSCNGKIKFDNSWLRHIPALQVLKISHCQLDESPIFDPPQEQLHSLILNRNNMRRLRVATIRSLPRLQRLEVNFNQLQELKREWFVKGHPLKILSANGNAITRVDPLLNLTLDKLSELRLNRNRLCRLASGSFKASAQDAAVLSSSRLPLGGGGSGKRRRRRRRSTLQLPLGLGASRGGSSRRLQVKSESGGGNDCPNGDSFVLPAMPSVHTLELSRNRISTVHTLTFKGWTNLKVLRLKRNQLREGSLQPGAFFIVNGGLEVLDLTANKMLTSVRSAWLYMHGQHLKQLLLSKCGLRGTIDRSVFSSHVALQRLDLSFNKLTQLSEGQFSGLRALQELSLRGNRLVALVARVFKDLTGLQQLSLADNQISSLTPIESSAYPRVAALPASSPFSLRAPRGLFPPLSGLKSLDLARNKLSRIERNDLRGLAKLEVLDLRGNKIARMVPPTKHCPRLKVLLLDSPSMDCDCVAAPFLLWLSKTFPSGSGAGRGITANCSSPPALAGRAIASLPAPVLGKCEPRASLEPKVLFRGNKTMSMLYGGNLTLRCEVVIPGVPLSWTKEQRENLRPKVVWERVLPSGPHAHQRQRLTSGSRRGLPDTFPQIKVTELMTLQNAANADSPGAHWLSLLQLRPGPTVGPLGSFQCVARNAHGRDTSPLVSVNVYQLPRFTDSPEPVYSIIAGTTVNIPCSAVGHPQPLSALRKAGGIEFPAAKDRRLTIYTGDVHFNIANVQRKDAGDYLCESTNDAGRIFKRFTLEVNEIPSFVKPPRPQAVFTEGQSAVLSCLAAGWPFPSITWTKNGRRLVLHRVLNPSTTATPATTAAAVTPAPPTQKNQTLVAGAAVSAASLIIRPQRRSRRSLASDVEEPDLQLANRGQLLVFLSVRPEHAAEYECSLLNVVGRNRARIVVDVRTPSGIVPGRQRPAVKEPRDPQREEDGSGLQFSHQLTGIIVIAVVVCVVATSLAWVAALYCFRWRKRASAAAAAAAAAATSNGGDSSGALPEALCTGRRPLLSRSLSTASAGAHAGNIFMTSSGGYGGHYSSRLCAPPTSASTGSLGAVFRHYAVAPPNVIGGGFSGIEADEEEMEAAATAAARLLLEKHRRLRRDATKAYDGAGSIEDDEEDEEEEGGEEMEEESGRNHQLRSGDVPTSDYNTGTSSECSANSLCVPPAASGGGGTATSAAPPLPPVRVTSFGVTANDRLMPGSNSCPGHERFGGLTTPPYVTHQRFTVYPHAPPVSSSSPLLHPRPPSPADPQRKQQQQFLLDDARQFAFAYPTCADSLTPELVGLTAFGTAQEADDCV